MAGKKTLLEVMTKALRDGRDRRAADRNDLDAGLKEAIEDRDRESIGLQKPIAIAFSPGNMFAQQILTVRFLTFSVVSLIMGDG
jgi:hypothetical protein